MTNNDLPLSVFENEDGSFTIEWDENDPRTAPLNGLTEDDFVEVIRKACEDEIIAYEERQYRTEFTVEEFEHNWDELFSRVENGETLTIITDEGQSGKMVPYSEYECLTIGSTLTNDSPSEQTA